MDRPQPATLVRIGDCVLDRERDVLMRAGKIVQIRAKTFALLTHMADNRGRVLTKDELLAAIWPDVTVSEDSLTQAVRDLRKALGDEQQRWVRTVSRRGYLLADPDATAAYPPEAEGSREEAAPVIAVLPFAVAADCDPVLADGIVEEVTNALARFRTVTVVARASAFRFPVEGRSPPATIGRQLGANYLVEGVFRRIGKTFRIVVTLTNAPTGIQAWGDRFDCTEAELLEIDTEITLRIVTRLVANIEQSMIGRRAAAPSTSLRAFEYLAHGRMLLRGYGEENNQAARDCFVKALEIDPNFALAQAYLALADVIIGDYGAAPRSVLEAARDRAALALMLAPEESRCHRIMGLIQLYLRMHASAENYLRTALDLNPYDADALAQMGFVLSMRGRAAEGLRWLERAIELNPFRPPWYDSDIVFCLYSLGHYDKCIEVLNRVPDSGIFQQARLAAAHAMAGNPAAAAEHIAKARDLAGSLDLIDYMRKVTEFEHESDFDHLRDGLEQAGAPYLP